MLNIINYLFNLIVSDKNTADYILFNKKIFNQNHIKSKGVILVEFHNWHPLHIAFSFLSNFLSKKFLSQIVAYPGYINISQNIDQNFTNKIKWTVGNFLGLKNFGVYRSFGTKKILYPMMSKEIIKKGTIETEKKFKKLKNKNDVLKINIEGILIGDLIYDTFLKKFKVETVDIKSADFYEFFQNTVILFYYWKNYFKLNKVNAVIISHAVYTLAIPARIAMSNKVKVFISNHSSIYNLTKKNYLSFKEFKFFKSKYLKLNKKIRNLGIKIAKDRIKKRFEGKIGVDMWYSKASSFQKVPKKIKRVINENNKIKVLIATHCLFDSPHVSGNFFFTDFSEWLNYLGKLSNKLDYDWYLKSHPYYIKESFNKINKIIRKYPKIKILDPSTSHHQIIKEGIDIVLTCMGTIGFEYALFNKTVVNASIHNPHYLYNFNLNPNNLIKYKYILNNLKKYKKMKINKNQIYMYYFMMHIFHPKNWLFNKIEDVEKKCGSYYGMYSSQIYQCFKEEFSSIKFNKINNIINDFYNSKNFKLEYNNISKNFREYLSTI